MSDNEMKQFIKDRACKLIDEADIRGITFTEECIPIPVETDDGWKKFIPGPRSFILKIRIL